MFKLIKSSILILTIIYCNICCGNPPIFVKSIPEAIELSKELNIDALIIFTADWCGPCKVMKNDIHDDLDMVQNTVICYVDYDTNKDIVKKFKVKIIPDYMIYRNNQEIKRTTGYDSKDKFINWLK